MKDTTKHIPHNKVQEAGESIASKTPGERITDFLTGTNKEYREVIKKIDARLAELGDARNSPEPWKVQGKHVDDAIRDAYKDNGERVKRANMALFILSAENVDLYSLQSYGQAFYTHREHHPAALVSDEFMTAFPAVAKLWAAIFHDYVEAVAKTGMARELGSERFLRELGKIDDQTVMFFLTALRETPPAMLSSDYIIARVPVKQDWMPKNYPGWAEAYARLLEPLGLPQWPEDLVVTKGVGVKKEKVVQKEFDPHECITALERLGIPDDARNLIRDGPPVVNPKTEKAERIYGNGWPMKHPKWLLRLVCFAEQLGNHSEGSAYFPGFEHLSGGKKEVKLYIGSLTREESLDLLTAQSEMERLQGMDPQTRRYFLGHVHELRGDAGKLQKYLQTGIVD